MSLTRPEDAVGGAEAPAAAPAPSRRALLLPLVFGIVGTLILLGLGTWQLQRLAWKEGLIAEIETRLAADPVAVPAAPDPGRHQYLRVRAEGVLGRGELHVYTPLPQEGVGYRIIAPLELEGGRRILLDRGVVPSGAKDAERPAGPVAVEGVLHWPQETDFFTAAPDLAANIWFARDPAAMATALGTEPTLLVVEAADATHGVTPLPVTAALRNPHLEYAVTWFGLAAVWAGMTAYWLWRLRRPDG